MFIAISICVWYSNNELIEIFKNLANSLFDGLPNPSAILLGIDTEHLLI